MHTARLLLRAHTSCRALSLVELATTPEHASDLINVITPFPPPSRVVFNAKLPVLSAIVSEGGRYLPIDSFRKLFWKDIIFVKMMEADEGFLAVIQIAYAASNHFEDVDVISVPQVAARCIGETLSFCRTVIL